MNNETWVDELGQDHITIETIGVLHVTGARGEDLTPGGDQGRALLAILALSPRMTVSRRWLEALLWSDRDPRQASGSLRQALRAIRKQLGRYADTLKASRTDVALDPQRTHVDLFDAPSRAGRRLAEGRELLEGTDLRSEGFEDWLRDERARLRARPGNAAPPDPAEALAGSQRLASGAGSPEVPIIYASTGPANGSSTLEAFLAEAICAQLSRTVSNYARSEVRLIDGRITPIVLGSGSQCMIRVSRNRGGFVALVRLSQEPSGRIYWHRQAHFDAADLDETLDAAAALALEATEAFSACREQASSAATANAMATAALRDVFSFDPVRLARGAALLAEANDLDPLAPRPALQALALAFLALEKAADESDGLKGQVLRLIEASRALSPDNPLANAFLADVYDLVFHDPQTALSMAKSALRSDPGLGYAYASLGGLELRRGKTHEALAAATRAERQLQNSSLEVFALMRLCVASMSLGDFATSVSAAERAAMLAPHSCPPLRHLYALRLRQNDLAGARAALSALRRLEPGFSMARLREDPAFPAVTLRSVGFHQLQDVEI